MPTITRRRALAGGTALLAAPFLARPALAQGGELRMLTWEGYAEDDWIAAFEERTGATVNVAYAGSVDEMFARMSGSGGADFDMVAVDTSSIPRYVDAGLLQPIDLAQVPAAANLQPAFADVAELSRDGATYGAPFAWGSLGLAYDTEHFAGGAPDSWAVMWDPANEGRLISLDDANNCIVNTAIHLGIPDPFNLSDEEFEQVKAALIEQKRLLLTYFAGFDEGVQIFKDNGVVAMFAMGEPQAKMLKEQGVAAEYVIPREGAIGWLDCLLMSAGARDPALVHAWMDYALDRSVGQAITDRFGYGNTTNVVTGMDYAERLFWLQPPEDFERRIRVWNEVKAAV